MNPEYNFSKKTIIITGATAGIGFRTALEFCRRGAVVIGVGRSPERCQSAREAILREVPQAKIEYLIADLSRQSEVRRLADEIKAKVRSIDVLVNDAGTYMGKLVLTEDSIETTIAVNHIAPFLLTNLLLPLLEKTPDSRIITVSSESHQRTFIRPEHIQKPLLFIGLWQYKLSKLANILFTVEFNRRRRGFAPHAFAVDPGLVNTDIGLKGTDFLTGFVWRKRQHLGVDPIQPATTILTLAGDDEAPMSDAVYWRDSKPSKPARNAVDADLAFRLWEMSVKLCHLEEKREIQ
jgi:retinol dehydrogenase 12